MLLSNIIAQGIQKFNHLRTTYVIFPL